ncbi:MAG: hypothetical protein KF742_01710 [Cryobacterium sp.]|nr:hypothetical protein [Cryobacterium sp.]
MAFPYFSKESGGGGELRLRYPDNEHAGAVSHGQRAKLATVTDETTRRALLGAVSSDVWRAVRVLAIAVPLLIAIAHAHFTYRDLRKSIEQDVREAARVYASSCVSAPGESVGSSVCAELRVRATADISRIALERTVHEHLTHVPGYSWCVEREHCGWLAARVADSLALIALVLLAATFAFVSCGPCKNVQKHVKRWRRESPLPLTAKPLCDDD